MNRFSQLGSGPSSSREGNRGGGESIDGSGTPATSSSTSLLENRLTGDGKRAGGITRSNPTGMMNGPVTTATSNSKPIQNPSGSSEVTIKSPSSAIAHRGPYVKPAFLDQRPTSSRYTPYSRKPIFVGAKKMNEDPIEPHLTSTAQRMIDILSRNSTPVVDGLKKILPYATMKTTKPIMSSVRGGPPITRSPLILDLANPLALPVLPSYLMNTISVSKPSTSTSGAVKQLPITGVKTSPYSEIPFTKIPATASPLPEFKYDDDLKSIGGGKLKGKTTRVHESITRPGPSSSLSSTFVVPPIEFKPPPPLSTKVGPPAPVMTMGTMRKAPVARYVFSAPLVLKPKAKSFPNGLPEENEFWKGLFAAVKGYTPVPGKSTGSAAGGTTVVTTSSVPSSSLSSLPPLSANVPPQTWACPTCYIHNKMIEPECVCCKAKRPVTGISSSKSNIPQVQAAPSKWACPTCCVDNEIRDASCVCCAEPRPSKYSVMAGGTGTVGTGAETTKPAEPTFKFGFANSSSAFGGAPKSSSSETTPSFKFGIASSQSTTRDSVPEAFKFGTMTTKVTTASGSTPGFTFGTTPTPTSTPTPTTTIGFKFGVTVTTTTTSTASSPSSPPGGGGGGGTEFKFGLSLPTSSSSTTTSTSPGGSKLSDFKFGLGPTTSSSSSPQSAGDNKSPMSASAFRKGFGFTTKDEEVESKKNGKTEVMKFPGFSSAPPPAPAPVPKNTVEDIAKYKFPVFSGGPKPPAFTTPAPTPAPISFTAHTTTVSSSPNPISFGGPLVATSAPTATTKFPAQPTPFVNGIGSEHSKPITAQALPDKKPFSFGISPTSSSLTTTSASSQSPGAGRTGFVFGGATTSPSASFPPSSTSSVPPTMFTFGGGTSSAMAATTTAPVPSSQVFTFGQGESHKRKAVDSEGNNGGFQFTPSEPKLKMRAEAAPAAVASGGLTGTGMKTGSFLEAMKQPGFGTVSIDKPDGHVQQATSTFGSTFRTGGFNNPNAGIQFSGMNTFSPPASAPVPSATPGFTFGAPTAPASTGNNAFNFGSVQQASATTPAPQFNLVPSSFAFGQNSGAPSTPVLFSAGASPAAQPGSEGRRPTKRAVRRLR